MSFSNGAGYRRQYFIFNDKSSKDFFLYLSGPGVYDSPAPDTESVSVPGMNGDIISENAKSGQRRFSNIDIRYEAFFRDGLPAKTAAVKSWLLSPVGYKRLQDTYDPDFFRMAVCTSAVSFDVTRQYAAKMELAFNCKPQRWSVEGQTAIGLGTSGGTVINPYDFPAQPLITLVGTGAGTLKVGDAEMEITGFPDSSILTLDCETHNAYAGSGGSSFCNGCILCEGDFPQLPPGETTISWSGSILEGAVIPRWWTL